MWELLALILFVGLTASLFACATWWAEKDDDEEDY